MGRRQATIRDANAANACTDAVARRCGAFRSVCLFAVFLLLLCAPILRAQVVLGTTTGDTNALTINSNNSGGQAYNAVLNSDSSVSLLQNGAILSGQGCPAFSGLSSGISSGAVYVDSAHNNIYLAMLSGGTLHAAYETIGPGTCTQGPLLQLTTNALSNLEMNVDPVQGTVYILNSFGAFPDALYILPIASWSASSATELNMDYSAQYGPIVIDPSNHQVYVNDLGDTGYGAAGTYGTSGFFVYDPNHSATPANNLQHVVGYKSGGTTTVLNVGTLLDNGTGKLVLINENPSASTVNLAVPITILDTTQFSFFTNTSNPYTYNSDVDITPGAGLSTISATSLYTAIGGADIDPTNDVVYVFGFNSNSLTTPGLLLEYNLSSTAETVLSSSAAMPSLYGSLGPWNQLNFNSGSTELVLSVGSQYGSGALGLTSQLCAGTPVSLTQLFGSSLAPTPLGYPVVNSDSGYTYAIQPAPSYPPGPSIVNFVAPPSGGCSSSPPIVISPTTLYYGFAGESYFVDFTATGGSGTGYTWSVTSGTALSNVGLSLTSAGVISGYPNAAETAVPLTVKVVDSQGNTASENLTLTIYPTFSITPTTLLAGSVGTPYSQTFIASGGAGGPFTFSVASGTALSDVGLSLSSGGTISGTPSTTETAAAFVLRVADSLGNFSQLNYTLTINSASSAPITINDPETVTVNDLPQVQLVDVSDPETITVTDIPVVTVGSPLNFTSGGSLPAGDVNANYSFTITASGGLPPYTFTVAGLPAGLSIAANTGIVSGTPIATGTSTFTVMVTDSASDANTSVFSLTVDPALTIAGPASLPAGIPGVAYPPTTITANGGSGVYTWSATGLPAGLSIGSTTGTITGAANTGGAYYIIVKVEDANGITASKNYTIAVALPSVTVSANPGNITIVQEQSGQSTLTFTPQGNYTGTFTLSVSGLPSSTSDVFTLNGVSVTSVTLTGNNQTVNVVLTINSDVSSTQARTQSAPTSPRRGAILTAIVFWCPGSLLGLIALRRKRKLLTKNPGIFALCVVVLLAGTLAGLAGCISGGGFGTYVTPAGSSTVTVVATPGAGGPQTVNIGLTITQQ
jgi:hypothetical protein